jgi:hypothetical protein
MTAFIHLCDSNLHKHGLCGIPQPFFPLADCSYSSGSTSARCMYSTLASSRSPFGDHRHFSSEHRDPWTVRRSLVNGKPNCSKNPVGFELVYCKWFGFTVTRSMLMVMLPSDPVNRSPLSPTCALYKTNGNAELTFWSHPPRLVRLLAPSLASHAPLAASCRYR